MDKFYLWGEVILGGQRGKAKDIFTGIATIGAMIYLISAILR